MNVPTIAIIGGGFSGTVTAVNLARHCHQPLRICLVNSGCPTGRGVAYGTRRPEHLLNVVARNMSALADRPSDFVDWLKTRVEYLDTSEADLRETFVPRRIYGDYLCSLLHGYMRPEGHASKAQIELIDGEVVDITVNDSRASILTADGRVIEADRVVLALGNQPPTAFPSSSAPLRHPNYIDNPWTDWELRLHDRERCAVLLGTGLTMIDVFLTLSACDWRGPIVAVSRNGLLPWSHFRGIEYPDFLPTESEGLRLGPLADLLERHCSLLRKRGENPAIVVDKVRQRTQHIWKQFTVEEKQEFCRRHRSTWNVIRHRVPSQIHQFIATALASGALSIEKGSICELTAENNSIHVTIENREKQKKRIEAGLVINCTGPQESIFATTSPLLKRLFDRGLVSCDEMDMGIEISPNFAVIDSGGKASTTMYAIGPLLKGTLWETTAVPELRIQAMQIAQSILMQSEGQPMIAEDWKVPAEELLEYCI